VSRRTVISIVIVAALPASIAEAAGLVPMASGALGSGRASVVACDSNGFVPSYATSGGNVASVTVSGIADPACEGASLKLTVVDGTGTALGSGGPQTIPTDADTLDNSMTVAVSPRPAAASAAGVHVSVVGP
jgi:hypothetical protein